MPEQTPKPKRDIFSTDWVGEAPPAPPAPAPLTMGQRVGDVVGAVNAGIGTAAHEMANFGAQYIGGGMRLGEKITNKVFGLEDQNMAGEVTQSVTDGADSLREADGSNYEGKTVVGAIAKPVAQFATGMIAAGSLVKGSQLYQGLSTTAKGVVTGMAADATAFDPSQDRLSNLVNDFTDQHTDLRSPITDFLAANPEDSDSEGRLKNALEGALAGAAIGKMFTSLKRLKDVVWTRETKGAKAAEQKLIEYADAMKAEEDAAKVVDEAPKLTDEAPKDANGQPRKPDDTADYSAGVQGPDAPLMTPELSRKMTEAIKDNPDWLSEGFVNTKGSGFNFSKMDSPDGAKLAMDEMAKALPPPRVYTFKEMVEEAKDLGVDVADDLNSGKVKTTEIVKTLLAGKALMQSTARQVADLARGLERNPGNKAELEKALQRLANTQTAVKSLQSEAARATTAGRIRTLDSFSPDELKAIAASGGSLEGLLPIIKEKSLSSKLWDVHNQLWINSLLSGPRTHIKNGISNSVQAMLLPLERAVGGALGGDKETMREGVNLAIGLSQSIKESLRLAVKVSGIPELAKSVKDGDSLAAGVKKAKDTGASILDPGNSKLASSGAGGGAAISTENFKSLQGTQLGVLFDGFGQITNLSSRFLTSADEFFKQGNYRAFVTADATTEGMRKGLKGQDLTDYIADRLVTSMDESGAALNKEALDYARRATFTQPFAPGSPFAKIENIVHAHPYFKLVTPFIKTPIRILEAAAIRTPILGQLRTKFWQDVRGKNGARAKADTLGQMAVGASLWTAAITLAHEGLITGRGPNDSRERATLQGQGADGSVNWAPYSLKVGGKFVSFDGLDPLSMFLGLAGDYADTQAHMKPADAEELIAAMSISLAQNVTSKSFLLGATQVMDALSSPDKKMESFIRSRVGSYVPSGIKQAAGLVGMEDPHQRETRSIADTIMNRLPGFSTMLPPKRNIFGEAITARQALGPDSVSPFYTANMTTDKVTKELARFSRAFSPPVQKIGNLDLTQFKNAKGQDFYDRMQEATATLRVGRYTLKESLDNLVSSSRYAKWRESEPDALSQNDEPKTLLEVRAIISSYREHALKNTLKEYPEVQSMVQAQKRASKVIRSGNQIPEFLRPLLNQQ